MIPLPHDATHTDIDQWCSRGVVMVEDEKGGFFPAFFGTVSSRRVVEAVKMDGDHVLVPYNRVYVHWPRCGSINLPGLHYAVHAARRTQRQYRRTFFNSGLFITTPRSWDVAKFVGAVPTATMVPPKVVAEACFSPVYYGYAEAEALITSEQKVSVALTPRVIMAGDKSGKRMFYYNGVLAATAVDGMLHPAGQAVPVRKIAKLLEGRFYVSEHS
jgi:hypothetical protein